MSQNQTGNGSESGRFRTAGLAASTGEILHVLPYFADAFGGSVTAVRALLMGLERRGMSLRVWTSAMVDFERAAAPTSETIGSSVVVERFGVLSELLFARSHLAITPSMLSSAFTQSYRPGL